MKRRGGQGRGRGPEDDGAEAEEPSSAELSNSLPKEDTDRQQKLGVLVVLHPQPSCDVHLFSSAFLESAILNEFLKPPRCYPVRFICNDHELYDHLHENRMWFNVSDRGHQSDLTCHGRLYYVRGQNKLRIYPGPRMGAEKQASLRNPVKFGPQTTGVKNGQYLVVANRALLIYHPHQRCFTEYIFDRSQPDHVYLTKYPSIDGCLFREEPEYERYGQMGVFYEQSYVMDVQMGKCFIDVARSRRYLADGWFLMKEELEKLIDHVSGAGPLPLGPSLSAVRRLAVNRCRPYQKRRSNKKAAKTLQLPSQPPFSPLPQALDWTYCYDLDQARLSQWLTALDRRGASILLVLSEPIEVLDSVISIVRRDSFHTDRSNISLLFLNIAQYLIYEANGKCSAFYGHLGAVAPMVVSVDRPAERKAESSRSSGFRLAEHSFLYRCHADLELEALHQSVFNSYSDMMLAIKRQISEPDMESHCLILGPNTEQLRIHLKTVFPPSPEKGCFLHRLVFLPPSRAVASAMATTSWKALPSSAANDADDTCDDEDSDDISRLTNLLSSSSPLMPK